MIKENIKRCGCNIYILSKKHSKSIVLPDEDWMFEKKKRKKKKKESKNIAPPSDVLIKMFSQIMEKTQYKNKNI